jgi:hypothetical protein
MEQILWVCSCGDKIEWVSPTAVIATSSNHEELFEAYIYIYVFHLVSSGDAPGLFVRGRRAEMLPLFFLLMYR